MVYDSIPNASIPTAASNSKDFGRKKKVNRAAKLKQSKLDVRREQWLSQVKNRGLGFKEEQIGTKKPHADSERDIQIVKLEVRVDPDANEGLMNRYSDSESPVNSPTNFAGSSSGSSSSSRGGGGSGSGSGSGGCFSRSVTDEDDDGDGDDDCVDDWEAIADALAADDVQTNHNESNLVSPVQETAHVPDPETVTVTVRRTGQEAHRAWRPDDASRPQSLPNLLKQNSFPMKSATRHGFMSPPSSCPICCEDLDITDSTFLPCPCGYRLCLFCHKRILEDNGRCPGCRKQYDQIDNKTTPFKLARCYSVNPTRLRH